MFCFFSQVQSHQCISLEFDSILERICSRLDQVEMLSFFVRGGRGISMHAIFDGIQNSY